MKFVIDCIKGMALGAGAILPGISSGVLCVIFGIYEKLVDSILGFFKDIKNNIRFLLPLAIGGFIGVILFGNILKFLFNEYPMYANIAFIGLILGCIPALLKKANENTFRLHYLIYTFISFMIAMILLYLENNFISTDLHMNSTPIYLFFAGFVMSVGVVVPGVSSSVLLMILGVYNMYLEGISTLNVYILIPMGIGLILGGICFLKAIKFCLTKYFSQTYYSIVGFVLGSVLILYSGISFNIVSILIFITCFYIAQKIG